MKSSQNKWSASVFVLGITFGCAVSASASEAALDRGQSNAASADKAQNPYYQLSPPSVEDITGTELDPFLDDSHGIQPDYWGGNWNGGDPNKPGTSGGTNTGPGSGPSSQPGSGWGNGNGSGWGNGSGNNNGNGSGWGNGGGWGNGSGNGGGWGSGGWGSGTGAVGEIGQVVVVLDQIVNLGKKLWSIVEAGKPVVNIKSDMGSALPEGVKGWQYLQQWKGPKAKTYRVAYKNGFGMEVVQFAFRVLYTYGGNVGGKGLYLTNVTIAPANISVSWGFSLNAQATIPSVINTGTTENPVAGMELLMKWGVGSPIRQLDKSVSFFIKGDGDLTIL